MIEGSRRKHEEDAQSESDERLRILAENASDVISEVDAAAIYTYVSPNVSAILGYSPDDLLGRDAFQFFHPRDHGTLRRALSSLFSSGDAVEIRYRHRTLAGGWRWIESKAKTYETAAGERRAVVVCRDVHARIQAEQQLRRAERLASLGTLAASIAHEINNPVGAIRIAAEYARRQEGQDPAALRACLDDIIAEARRCGGIVRSVLSFARGGTSEKAPTDLNALIRGTCDGMRGLLSTSDATLELELGEDLPLLALSSIDMQQVVVNLVTNAVVCASQGVHLRIRTSRCSDGVRLSVSDDGPGMSAEVRERAFDPFFTTREEGTGLGLSVAHGIVTDHGGSIRLHSEPGRGTQVVIQLPDGAPG